jgi:hypothetical protein
VCVCVCVCVCVLIESVWVSPRLFLRFGLCDDKSRTDLRFAFFRLGTKFLVAGIVVAMVKSLVHLSGLPSAGLVHNSW